MSKKNNSIEIELTLEELIEIVLEALRLPEGIFEEFLELYMNLKDM